MRGTLLGGGAREVADEKRSVRRRRGEETAARTGGRAGWSTEDEGKRVSGGDLGGDEATRSEWELQLAIFDLATRIRSTRANRRYASNRPRARARGGRWQNNFRLCQQRLITALARPSSTFCSPLPGVGSCGGAILLHGASSQHQRLSDRPACMVAARSRSRVVRIGILPPFH